MRPVEKRCKNETVIVASPESVPNHLNPVALRKAKIVCNFGLSECNRVKIYNSATSVRNKPLDMDFGIFYLTDD